MQLSLNLSQPRRQGRSMSSIDRLHAVLRRQSIEVERGKWKGMILFRPMLGTRHGYECLCAQLAWSGGQAACFERRAYVEGEPMTFGEHLHFQAVRRELANGAAA